jgi:ATP-dependent DNA helicase RecG
MDIVHLNSLIQKGESHTTEFKKSTTQLRPAFETICAFLNADGGSVFIGVADDGKIVGQEVTDNTRKEIAREIDKIEPPAQINISYVTFESNQQVITITVAPGNHAPYTYDGRPFERNQTTVVRMAQHRYDQLVSRRFQHNFSWEKLEAEGYSFDDLDHERILGVVRKAVEVRRMPEDALRQEIPELLSALQLSINGRILNAAVALFAKKINPVYPQFQLKMARFSGIEKDTFLDSQIQYGNIFELLDSGMLFITRHLPLAAKFEAGKVERVETPIIPFDAIRETIINSLCHRDYGHRGGSIGLAIYDNRMEVFNSGGLQPDVTLEKIKSGFSNPPNPLIADVLYRCNLIEKWGRGIPKIMSSCKAANDPEPEFIIDQVEFKILFRFPVPISPPLIIMDNLLDAHPDLTPRQMEIIQILTTGTPRKPKEILENLKEPTIERTLRRELSKLRDLHILETKGHGPSVVWFLIPKNK